MQVTQNKVVSFDYTLKNDEGEVLFSSEERKPLSIIHGAGRIIPGLENALEGREEGESFSVSIDPGDAYGDYDDALLFTVDRGQFRDPDNLQIGMQVEAQMQDGSTQLLTVRNIEGEEVTLDANHPLAGQSLHFDIHINEVREATQKELDEGTIRE
ncbi:MAG: peptidylprolyl isomerase [Spirochaetes bacterium]|nr:MAG: peptidylprolyl isomerase [Spirochaetota bacterium]